MVFKKIILGFLVVINSSMIFSTSFFEEQQHQTGLCLSRQQQAFEVACSVGDLSAIVKAISCGASINHIDERGVSGPLLALFNERTKVLEYLVNHPLFDAKLVLSGGKTLLSHVAGIYNFCDEDQCIISTLCKKQLNLNLRDNEGFTALMHAIRINNKLLIEYLVRIHRSVLSSGDFILIDHLSVQGAPSKIGFPYEHGLLFYNTVSN